MELASKLWYAGLGLGTALALAWGALRAGGHGLCFALFASMCVGGGLICIFERSVVRSAFALLLTFAGTAGLFALLEADFLAAAQLLIYVGGVLALLLFGVMLTPPDLKERKLPRVLAVLVVSGLGVGWVAWRIALAAQWSGQGFTSEAPPQGSAAREVGLAFVNPEAYLVPFELVAVLLTVALVGAVFLARRRRADYAPEEPRA